MENLVSLTAMIISLIAILIMAFLIKKRQKDKSQLKTAMFFWLGCTFIWTLGSVLQILFQNYPIEEVFFEKISGVGVFFCPVAFLALSLIFAKTKIKIKMYHFLFLIIPIISTIIMLTNNHLMFEHYSHNLNEQGHGPWFNVHSIYTYALIIVGLVYFLRYSFKNAGFFSRQSILIIIGISIPLVLNILGTLSVIPMTTYITPISFSYMAIIYAFAIFRFGFMEVTPIALQRINDSMSDGYIVFGEDMKIIDFNKTLINMLNQDEKELRYKSWTDFQEVLLRLSEKDMSSLFNVIEKNKMSNEIIIIEKYMDKIDKYFNIEINSILSNKMYIGFLVLFKDITQHKKDQELILRRAEYDTLGKVARNIGHDLNSPEMAMSGYIYDMKETVRDIATGETNCLSESTKNDLVDCISCLDNCLKKMSQITNRLRVNVGNSNDEMFDLKKQVYTIEQLFGDKLRDNHCTLINSIPDDFMMSGDKINIDRIITNVIQNAIEAFRDNNLTGEINISATLEKEDGKEYNNIAISDNAGGIPESIKDLLFKEEITTKKDGHGIGLKHIHEMVTQNLRGKMEYVTKKGQGTTFFIKIPIEKNKII